VVNISAIDWLKRLSLQRLIACVKLYPHLHTYLVPETILLIMTMKV